MAAYKRSNPLQIRKNLLGGCVEVIMGLLFWLVNVALFTLKAACVGVGFTAGAYWVVNRIK